MILRINERPEIICLKWRNEATALKTVGRSEARRTAGPTVLAGT
jgi:hypothetical protein